MTSSELVVAPDVDTVWLPSLPDSADDSRTSEYTMLFLAAGAVHLRWPIGLPASASPPSP